MPEGIRLNGSVTAVVMLLALLARLFRINRRFGAELQGVLAFGPGKIIDEVLDRHVCERRLEAKSRRIVDAAEMYVVL